MAREPARRRGRLQHLDDGLPGSPRGPLVRRSDPDDDVPNPGEPQHQPRGRRVLTDSRCRASSSGRRRPAGHWQSTATLEHLRAAGRPQPGPRESNARALARKLRTYGVLMGTITRDETPGRRPRRGSARSPRTARRTTSPRSRRGRVRIR